MITWTKPPIRTGLALIAAMAVCGHPIATAQSLIVNGDFSAGNTGFSTDYSFISSGQSQTPSTFAIRTNTQDFNPAYTMFGDHSTGTGMMMLLDGYPASDKVAWAEMVSVTTNTEYLFSGWATSADPANPGTLRFLINGSLVGADLNLSTNAGAWTNFVVRWNSETNGTALLEIVDVSAISYGNDFALDDLAFLPDRPLLTIRQMAAQMFELGWASQTNVNYQLQWISPLNVSNSWQNLGAPVPGNGFTNYLYDSPSNQFTKCYRLKTVP